jgi:hypothetical protein
LACHQIRLYLQASTPQKSDLLIHGVYLQVASAKANFSASRLLSLHRSCRQPDPCLELSCSGGCSACCAVGVLLKLQIRVLTLNVCQCVRRSPGVCHTIGNGVAQMRQRPCRRGCGGWSDAVSSRCNRLAVAAAAVEAGCLLFRSHSSQLRLMHERCGRLAVLTLRLDDCSCSLQTGCCNCSRDSRTVATDAAAYAAAAAIAGGWLLLLKSHQPDGQSCRRCSRPHPLATIHHAADAGTLAFLAQGSGRLRATGCGGIEL